MLRSILDKIAAMSRGDKVLLGAAALVALGLSVALSRLLVVMATLVLIVAVIALLVQ